MLSSLRLKNFKAFEEASVDLRPITLLLGPNNSGKSSIIVAPRLLAQTVQSYDSRVPLLLNGIMGDFGTYKDIVYRNHRGRHLGIELTFSPVSVWGGAPKTEQVSIALAYMYRTVRRELVLKSAEVTQGSKHLLSTAYSEDSERQLIEKIGKRPVPSSIKSSLVSALMMRNFVPDIVPLGLARRRGRSTVSEFLEKDVENDLRRTARASRFVHTEVRRLEYVGAMRVPPARTHLLTGERRASVGSTGENAANILAMDAARAGSRKRHVVKRVGDWLSRAGIASDVKIEHLSDRHYELRVQHPVTREYQNFADVGYGHSQVLPVLVGGFNLPEGAIYIVEEPEIHLHPRAQAELGDFFLDLYQHNVQSIIETHSEHLILRLQQHVVQGNIPPEDIRLYYVYAKGSRKRIMPLELDDRGRFTSEWPEGFFPERLEEAKKLSRVRFQAEKSGA